MFERDHGIQAAIGSLRDEDVYDGDRSVFECGSETVAIPVKAPPTPTTVLEVIREDDPSGVPAVRSYRYSTLRGVEFPRNGTARLIV
ncbi:MAG: hypothetical protein V5A55_12540, partial [Halovenus sp.]